VINSCILSVNYCIPGNFRREDCYTFSHKRQTQQIPGTCSLFVTSNGVCFSDADDKGRCPLCFEKEDGKRILLECKETKHWRRKLMHNKWLNMNKEVACRKIIKITNRTQIKNVGKYLDIVKNKWFSQIKDK
jgi:hypothetical protein